MTERPFDLTALLEEAKTATGLADFGSDDFREGLGVLLETYEKTARFTPQGVKRNRRRLLGLLSGRLRMQAAFAAHPEIRERVLRRPVVLTGLPRSGTSALFNLLGCDPAARPLRLWEALFPDPHEGALEPGQSDPRRDAIEAHYARGREKNPEFTKVHYVGADNPEECVMVMAYAFRDVQMGIEVMMEPYASWFRAQDLHPTYATYHDILKLLDWQRPGERWLLKAPAHMWAIDVLVETFPDVCVVWTHRNPLQCTASICSMTAMLMRAREDFDPEQLGPVVMDFYASSLERGLAARDAQDPGRFIDVDYRKFVDDPLGVVRDIYRHFALPLPPEALGALREHVRANPKGKHGSHDYGLEAFGLTPERVRERFADYIRRFELPV